MRISVTAASLVFATSFLGAAAVEAHGPGGGHAGGSHSGGPHGSGGGAARPSFAAAAGGGGGATRNQRPSGVAGGGAKGSGLNAGQSGGSRFAGGSNGLAGGSAATFGNGAPPLNGATSSTLGGANSLAGNSALPAGNRIRLINGTNPSNGLGQQSLSQAEQQLLQQRLTEAHRLAELAKNSGDPKLAAEAQQMARRVEQQIAGQRGRGNSGGVNRPASGGTANAGNGLASGSSWGNRGHSMGIQPSGHAGGHAKR